MTHRDEPDFYLTAANREDKRSHTLAIAARVFLALMRSEPDARALVAAMHEVFPWVRHLGSERAKEFTVELINVLSDAAELDTDDAVHEVIAGWRATARIKTDPEHYREALLPSDGDFGPVELYCEPKINVL